MTVQSEVRSNISQAAQHQEVPYGFYVLIWVSLLVLTQFTVTAGQMDLGALGKIIAMIVTPAKAILVLLYFMHLRFQKPFFAYIFVFTTLSLVVMVGLTFSDYSFR